MNQNFDKFFAKYPKKSHYVYIVQDGKKNGTDIIATLERHGGANLSELSGSGVRLYYIHPTTKHIKCCAPSFDVVCWLKTFYTEIDVEPSVKAYTMQEIADKLGIDVANLRIKK